MVAINTQPLHSVQQIQGSFTDMTAGEVNGEEAEGLALTVSDMTNVVDWTYSATAEDNTTDVHQQGEAIAPSEMDLQPGLIYSGPSGVTVQVTVTELDILEGAISLAEENDSLNVAVYLNSTGMFESDEGLSRDLDTETAVEFNLSGALHNVQESDVIRIGIYSTTEETLDWDNTEGSGEWSVS